MQKRTILFSAFAAVLFAAPGAFGQAVNWRVVAGENGSVTSPGLPAGVSRTLTDTWLGDVGTGLIGLRIANQSTLNGYWALRQGALVRYAQIAVTGNAGPGRAGTEAGHVFADLGGGWGDASSDGQRVFGAQAGPPGSGTAASYGIWRWDTTRNIEVARPLVTGALGPGLAGGWTFANSSGFAEARSMNGGGVLLDADVRSSTGANSRALIRHVPGQGNQPCMRVGATEAALGPGLAAGDFFTSSWTLSSQVALTPAGRVYGRFGTDDARTGIWELCNGAPLAIAVDNEEGARGPNIGISTATFTRNIGAPVPGGGGSFVFLAEYRASSASAADYGLFRYDGSRNRRLAMDDSAGFYGPHLDTATWRSFDDFSVGGLYTAFTATVTTTDGGNPAGLWRVRAGQSPEPLALLDIPGAYGPESERTWDNFGAFAMLANGDVLLEATTQPGDNQALWLLSPGLPPRRILDENQDLSIPTAAGAVPAAISSFNIDNGGARFGAGIDGWVGADGSVFLHPVVSGYGEVLIVATPSDRIFKDGLEP